MSAPIPVERVAGRRVSNWPAVLAEFIAERRDSPFAWGRHDCCLFACDGVRALTGLDPAQGAFRGRYRGAVGAAKLVAAHGGIEAIAARQCAELGFAEWPTVHLAQRGDVVLLDVPEDAMGCAVGLCVGAQAAFVGRGRGLVFQPLAVCRRAWRVN